MDKKKLISIFGVIIIIPVVIYFLYLLPKHNSMKLDFQKEMFTQESNERCSKRAADYVKEVEKENNAEVEHLNNMTERAVFSVVTKLSESKYYEIDNNCYVKYSISRTDTYLMDEPGDGIEKRSTHNQFIIYNLTTNQNAAFYSTFDDKVSDDSKKYDYEVVEKKIFGDN